MQTYAEDRPAVSAITLGRSRDWVHHVISLLDAALHQLYSTEKTARGTILQAASLLRQQMDGPTARVVSDDRGRMLAWQVRKVRDYIDSHIAGRVLVADLCALVQRSDAHFSRSFKRTFGESPHAFLVRRRVELAAQYMLTTDAPLSDIALRCGFSDQAHLCKHFRQAAGQTPAVWRRVHRLHDDENEVLAVECFATASHNGTPVPAGQTTDAACRHRDSRAIEADSHNPERSRPSHRSVSIRDVPLVLGIVEVPLERA